MNRRGERALFVPRLEVEHARGSALIDRVASYPEYPHESHPMHILADLLRDMEIRGDVSADYDGYPWILGYRGPVLSEVTEVKIHNVRAFVEDQFAVKSQTEIGLIREGIRWANLAHTLLQRYTVVGASETEVAQRASQEATRAMLDAIGPIYRAQASIGMGSGAHAGYRGQIGRNGAIPHALANHVTFRSGDVLVSGAAAVVWGYGNELERTMLIGKPGDAQRRFFDHMLALQDTALAAMQPGKPCAEVDRAVRAYYEKHDLMEYWRHHAGHCIGLRYHEGPFLDQGDHTEMKPGMVFTVEPGLYPPELGGFRHSDTVLITDNGVELLTYYPRDLESLTLAG
jgi:Xaa-Pro aminopeptidase